MKQYNFDNQDIPEEYYDSNEWLEYQELLVERNTGEYHLPHTSKIYKDTNLEALRTERLSPILEDKTVIKIANCRFQVWLDTYRISATYDVAYKSGSKIFGRKASGSWNKEEAKTPTETLALDAVTTMIVRSGIKCKINFSRMHEHNSVKDVLREINLIELTYNGEPVRAWFIVNSYVYPARHSEVHDNRYEWCFNGRKKIAIDKFCDQCWEVVK
ncbi:hypothetical protein UFOVP647_39 [uncultured Caudovirales phage]|uniref:Uncharacterized protein n=1 Tax=uncultured Caudovirales phage TaxID=2100421 RepID=A0A6J5NA17_9CAUD|nr:hypothetical protein UFOVP647_39 [uncultured Caudovirales phage]